MNWQANPKKYISPPDGYSYYLSPHPKVNHAHWRAWSITEVYEIYLDPTDVEGRYQGTCDSCKILFEYREKGYG